MSEDFNRYLAAISSGPYQVVWVRYDSRRRDGVTIRLEGFGGDRASTQGSDSVATGTPVIAVAEPLQHLNPLFLRIVLGRGFVGEEQALVNLCREVDAVLDDRNLTDPMRLMLLVGYLRLGREIGENVQRRAGG